MNQLQCPNCGGEMIAIEPNRYKCKYCKKESFVNDNSELLTALNMGARLRYRKKFADAIEEYERAIDIDKTCAGAYWGKFLSEYGIEFVKDTDGSYKPTYCHRIQTTPATENTSFKKALSFAKGNEKAEYQNLCTAIEKERKRLVEILNKNDMPEYDIFICYKQNEDDTKTPTKESGLAKELYYKLTRLNYNVFFAEESLATQKGDYEVNIYWALHSAKIMFVLAGSADHVNAAWVKNEWSRFVQLAVDDPTKSLKVVCQDMNPEDLPAALKKEQAILVKDLDWYDKLRIFIQKYLVTKDKKANVSDIAKKRFDEFEQYRKSAVIARERVEISKTPEQILEEKQIKDIAAERADVLRSGILSERKIESLTNICTKLEPLVNTYFDAARLQLITQLAIVLQRPVSDEKQMLDYAVDISTWGAYLGILNTCTEEEKEYFQKLCETSKKNFEAEQKLKPVRKMIEQKMFDEALPYATNIANEYPTYQHTWAVLLLCKNKCTSYDAVFSKLGTRLLNAEEYKNMENCLFDKDTNCFKPSMKKKVVAADRSNEEMLGLIERLQNLRKSREQDICKAEHEKKWRQAACSILGIISIIGIAIFVLDICGFLPIEIYISYPLLIISIGLILLFIKFRFGFSDEKVSIKTANRTIKNANRTINIKDFLGIREPMLVAMLEKASNSSGYINTDGEYNVFKQIDRLIQTLNEAIDKNKAYIEYFIAHKIVNRQSLINSKTIQYIEKCFCDGDSFGDEGFLKKYFIMKIKYYMTIIRNGESQTFVYNPDNKNVILSKDQKVYYLSENVQQKIQEAIKEYQRKN